MQEAALRKKISELEEAMAAKDRENMTNRSMYDKMKKVNRNIKEVRCFPLAGNVSIERVEKWGELDILGGVMFVEMSAEGECMVKYMA